MPIQLTQFQDRRRREKIKEPPDKFTSRSQKVLKPDSERKRRGSRVRMYFLENLGTKHDTWGSFPRCWAHLFEFSEIRKVGYV